MVSVKLVPQKRFGSVFPREDNAYSKERKTFLGRRKLGNSKCT